ncbi:hypothetical protein [Niabella soli]|uniref:HMA domain-containing protein n=1 Tax=Niabella soli DSM 19437 TaxID=929713 RepID=W0EXB7_9BACT|nr:hypothetical protein [Niabella soli]AHF15470.1 hypothetical protein NIASO_10535 [Niabella soli DSM 19437]
MKRVTIFKTDVIDELAAKRIVGCLKKLLPGTKINFDLEDCDKILRVESVRPVNTAYITASLRLNGYKASVLD